MQLPKVGRNAAPKAPQQVDGSEMSHVTRMGPTPAPTQILSMICLLDSTGNRWLAGDSDIAQIRSRFQRGHWIRGRDKLVSNVPVEI